MSNPTEAAFLQRQQERIDQLQANKRKAYHQKQQQEEQRDNDNNDNNEETKRIQQRLDDWKARVRNLSTNTSAQQQQQQQQQHLRLEIRQLQEELQAIIRQQTTTTTFASTTLQYWNETSRWHKEFVECQQLLQAQKPRNNTKFVFARYRAAMAKQQQQQEQQQQSVEADSNKDTHVKDALKQKSHQQHSNNRHTDALEELQHSHIVISRGSVRVERTNGKADPPEQRDVVAPPSALVSLHHCTVRFSEDVALSQLHLLNCSHVNLMHDASQKTLQALHMTGCTHVTFTQQQEQSGRGGVQQVRLHESSELTCDCHITAGAILEGCQKVVFLVNANEPPPPVRDFDWLKPGVPSPNFVLRTKQQQQQHPQRNGDGDGDSNKEEGPSLTLAPKPSRNEPNSGSKHAFVEPSMDENARSVVTEEEDSSDEDEL